MVLYICCPKIKERTIICTIIWYFTCREILAFLKRKIDDPNNKKKKQKNNGFLRAGCQNEVEVLQVL